MILPLEAAIYEEHASNASFLWHLRDGAARDPAYDLRTLGALDARLEAHLDGLRLAEGAGWEVCESALEDGEAGEIFAACFTAVERGDLRAIARVLDVAGASAELRRGIIAALGWTAPARVEWMLPGLLDPRCPPALHYVGIAACAAHRRDPGGALGYAVCSDAPPLASRALRAVGELGRSDLMPELRRALPSSHAPSAFWAAWSGAILGDPEAVEALLVVATRGGPFAARASATVMRRMAPMEARARLKHLADANPKAALAGATALGDPALIPWIVDAMSTPELARAAGAAFSTITGIDLQANKLRGPRPKGAPAGPTDDPTDENVALDREENLAFPDPSRVSALWAAKRKDLELGVRHLLGKPMGAPGWLDRVLRDGAQPARAAAAEEQSIAHPRRPLFEVRAPAPRQRAELRA